MGRIAATMSRIDGKRAANMLEELQGSPAHVDALIKIAHLRPVDVNFIDDFKVRVQDSIEDPYEQAAAYYNLALALPEVMQDIIRTLVLEAENWFTQKPLSAHVDEFGMRTRYEISESSLRLLKAKALLKLFQPNNNQTLADEVMALANRAGFYRDKRLILLSLFEHVKSWPTNAQINLLRYVLKKSVNKGLDDIQATIAASVPVLYTMGEFALLDELWQQVHYRTLLRKAARM